MKEELEGKYIRFDWAMKRLLRDEQYIVVEGLLSTILEKTVRIHYVFANGYRLKEKHDNDNRFDMLVKDCDGVGMLIELQIHDEYAYFEHCLLGTSNFLEKCIDGEITIEQVQKIYCINIITFSFDRNTDFVYHGKTEFRGIHNNELLRLSPFQRQTFKVSEVSQLYPEYYILKVNDFDRWSKVPLEQWIYFLNTGEIPDDATAPGLPEARERLKLARLSKSELAAYYRHMDNVVILRDNIYTEREEGRLEGRAEGLEEGLQKGRLEAIKATARNLKSLGMAVAVIMQATGLSQEEIEKL